MCERGWFGANGARLPVTCRTMLFVLLALFCFSAVRAEATVGGLTPTGSLATPRLSVWLVVLDNGKVLVPGGETGQDSNGNPTMTGTAELFDPAAKTWSSAGTMTTLRMPYFAFLLSSGKVLAGGGFTGYDASNNAILTSAAELYDPTSNSWTTANSMSHPHYETTPCLLGNGKVLVAGGVASTAQYVAPTNKADIYDPQNNSWTSTTMATARKGYASIILQSGKLLIIGGITGYDANTPPNAIYTTACELFDPTTGTWSAAGSMSHPHGSFSDPQMFSDGKVLVYGGLEADGLSATTAEIYNPATNSWSSAGTMTSAHMMVVPRKLSGDRVFLAGGADVIDYSPFPGFSMKTTAPTTHAEIYTEAANSWTSAGDMVSPHFGTFPVMLGNGKIIIAGGSDGAAPPMQPSYTQTAELYDPATNSWSAAGSMITARFSAATPIPLSDGNFMVVGGVTDQQNFTATAAVDLYDVTTNSWSLTQLSEPKMMVPWTLLPDKSLLFVGGMRMSTGGSITTLASTDIYGAGAGPVAPTVTSTSPAAGVTGVSVSTTVKAVFSEAMNGSTITTATFYLDHGVTGSVSYDQANYTATFTPSALLAYNTTYTATIDIGITDLTGAHLTQKKTWSFTTSSQTKTLTVYISGTGAGSVQSTPSGINNCTAGSCVTQFSGGTVTLTPTPVSTSSLFGGWSGACTNTSGNCVLTMDADKTVAATFNLFPPVHIYGGNYYSSLQSAYNAGATTCTIEAEAVNLTGDFTANLGKAIILEGGYDSSYGTNNGFTRLHGILTIGTGSVTVENIGIMP